MWELFSEVTKRLSLYRIRGNIKNVGDRSAKISTNQSYIHAKEKDQTVLKLGSGQFRASPVK